MTPGKLLIAQRLLESANELRAIADLMEEYNSKTIWFEVRGEISGAADTAEWFANKIRAER